MSAQVYDITLGTMGRGTSGFTFSVLGDLAANGADYLRRSQGENPFFTADYNNVLLTYGVEYKFEVYHPDYAKDQPLLRYTFDISGKLIPSSPSENPDNTLGASGQKTLLELQAEAIAVQQQDTFIDRLNLKIRQLKEFVFDQSATFINGAKPVIQRVFGQQVGISFTAQATEGGAFSEELFVGTLPDNSARWIDRFGSFRSTPGAFVMQFPKVYIPSRLRAQEMYIVAQDEPVTTDYLTTSNAFGEEGAYKQNRISFENFRNQLRATLRLRDLSDFSAFQNITFENGAQPVLKVPFGAQVGVNFEIQDTPAGSFTFAGIIGFDTAKRLFIRDRYGNYLRFENGRLVLDTNQLLLSGLFRAAQVGITSQDEVLATDFLTTSNANPALGSYFQNRISFANLVNQILALPYLEFTGEIIVRTSGRTVLPLATKAPTHFLVAEYDAGSGQFKDRFANVDTTLSVLMPKIITNLMAQGYAPGSSGTGTPDSWEVMEVCEYQEEIPDYLTPLLNAFTN